MNRLLRVAALAGLLAAAGPLRAQDDPNLATGLTPYQSFHGGDVDSVNLSNGNVVSHAPLVSYPQRGGKLRVAFDLVGNGKGAYIYKFCPPQHACVLLWVLGSSVRVLDNQQIGGGESNIIQLQQGGQTNKYLVFAVETPDGSLHTMALTNIGYYSIDGTGLFAGGQTYDYGWGPPYCTFHCGGYIDRDGIWYEPPRALVAREDPNGNQIAYTDSSYTAYLDTVGRTIPLPPAPSTSADLTGCTGPTTTYSAAIWNVPGPNGGSVTYKLCYGTQVLQGPTKCGAIYEPPITLHYLQSVLLPNNKSWVFEYNDRDPGDPSNINYGSLTKVTFPTGGTISYIYQTVGCGFIHASRSVISRTVDALDGPGGTSNPHTWTYTWGGGNLFSTPNTVTDPLGNDTVHSFSAFGTLGAAPYETQAQYYQGSKSTGTLLKTVNTSYITLANPTAGYIGPGAAALPTQVTTVWPDGKQTQIQKDYDAGPVFATNPLNPICCTFSTPGSYGDVTAEREYDYGSGAPGPLLRQTANTYLALSNTTYLDSNLLNLKSQVAVFSGSITSGDCSVNSAKACTKYTYDDQSPGLQSSGISTQHDSSPPLGTTYRGNQTSVSRWLNTSSSYLKSTAVFYDTGMVYQSTDPLLNTTTFTYSATFAGAYPTEIQLPTTGSVQHITYKNYDFNTGLLASHTDENGNQTTFSYDNMFRLKQVTFPTGGGQATVTRQETTFPFTATLTRQITGSLNMVTTNVFDGVGRVTQTQLTSDPDGTTYTDFTYDALGRKSTVSNPHRTQSAPTDGITTYNYDALGRTTKVIPPDGSSSSNYVLTQYCDNVTLATDQASHWRRSTVDGLGRMTEVDEPNSTSATVNVCPGTGEPIWATTYAYDTLNNLTNVTQSSSRQRTFVHDSLSRLTSSTNPEAGNVTYTYDADGNVKTKKDARNITITYSYDPLNRVLSSTYSNGDPTISYTYDQSACLGQSPCYNIGHRTGMTDAAGSEAWAYDTMGREAAEQRTTNSITKTTTYTYNLDGSLATLTYPSGRVITYAPGGAGRPLSAVDNTNSINYALSGTYAPQGALATLLLGKTNTFNGINLNDSFDSRLQPCRVFASTSTSVPNNCSDLAHIGNVLDFTYSFVDSNSKNNGNVIQITNNRDNTRTQSFTYDQLNRIATAKTQATSGANCWSYNYGYDQWANLLSPSPMTGYTCTEGTLSLGVNASNHINNTGFSYDSSGNMTNDGTNGYNWDAESQIKSAAGVNYTYDGDGNRVQKSNGKLYWYGMEIGPLVETDASGNLLNEYIFFGDKRIARRDSAGNVVYYFADHLGTARTVTSSTGGVLDDSDFYPFGGERVVSSSSGNTYKFTSKERDAESGLDNFGARYHGSALGRFMTPDPLQPSRSHPLLLQQFLGDPQYVQSRSAGNHLKGAAGRQTVYEKFGPFRDSTSRRPTWIVIYNDPGQ